MAIHPKQFGIVLKNARMDKKLTQAELANAIKLTRNNQIAAIWEEGYREGTYMGEMRLSAMMGRGKLRSGRQGRSFRSKRGSMSRNQPRKVWQQR